MSQNVPIVSQGSNPLNKTEIPRKNLSLKVANMKYKCKRFARNGG